MKFKPCIQYMACHTVPHYTDTDKLHNHLSGVSVIFTIPLLFFDPNNDSF
jgi:hypothetical protein